MHSSARLLSLAGLLGAGLLLTACTKKPSEEECTQFADHLVKLFEESREHPNSRIRKLAQNQRQSIIDECVGHGDVEEVECVLAQSSIGDVEANCK